MDLWNHEILAILDSTAMLALTSTSPFSVLFVLITCVFWWIPEFKFGLLLLRTDGGREVGVEEASELKRESDSVELLGTWWALMQLSISLAEKTYKVCIEKAEGLLAPYSCPLKRTTRSAD
jgi:hypothetical protein